MDTIFIPEEADDLVGLPPIAEPSARVLILGSMPGRRSLEVQQYYANRGNRFWKVAGDLLGLDTSAPYEKRTGLLTARGIALWDVLASCERTGSLDARIVKGTEVPNDFDSFLKRHPHIEVIGLNGKAAAKAFRQLVLPRIAVTQQLIDLPSTSAANAPCTYDELRGAWSAVMRLIET